MARRTVTKESTKCRSGRNADRIVLTIPGERGGKSADALGDHEGIAAHNYGYVVMPSGKGASFKVVQSELALEILIHPFGAPTFFENSDDLLLAHCGG